MIGVIGMIAGAGILVLGFNILEPPALALGDWGKVTIPALLGSSPWPVIGLVAAAAAIVLWLTARYQSRLAR